MSWVDRWVYGSMGWIEELMGWLMGWWIESVSWWVDELKGSSVRYLTRSGPKARRINPFAWKTWLWRLLRPKLLRGGCTAEQSWTCTHHILSRSFFMFWLRGVAIAWGGRPLLRGRSLIAQGRLYIYIYIIILSELKAAIQMACVYTYDGPW